MGSGLILNEILTHNKREGADRIDDLGSFFSGDWVKSEEGQQFVRKVFDSAFDAQMEDKQELFINILVNGVRDKETSNLEKLKFVDILRHLSLASLMILADMHLMFKSKVKEKIEKQCQSMNCELNYLAIHNSSFDNIYS